MDEIFPLHQAAIQEMFSVLDDEEKETFIALLKKLGLSLEK
jgi:MarR family 2-MHQ and catechol resistance regulon transcriptional repressor